MAQRYRKVDPRVWTDESFVSLTSEEKLLAMHVLTGERTNRCGMFVWSRALCAEQTGIDLDRIDRVFSKVVEGLSWVFDGKSNVLLLPRWWHYNQPDNPKALQGALSDLHDLPKHNLTAEFVRTKRLLKPKLHNAFDEVCHTRS